MGRLMYYDPRRCRMWSMHDRLGEDTDASSCWTLIESMRKHGQKHPVLGRELKEPEPEYEVELIYGGRRLFAAQYLGINLLVEVRDIDDRSALIEMDVENRVREDISPYERGLSYRRWLRQGFFETQAQIAKSLGISEAQVSRLLTYSQLPAAVVQAFNTPHDIKEEWAVVLAKRCQTEQVRTQTIRRAREVAQGDRQRSPQMVYDALVNGRRSSRTRDRDQIVTDVKGRTLFRVSFRSSAIHIIVPQDRIDKDALNQLTSHARTVLNEIPEKRASNRLDGVVREAGRPRKPGAAIDA